MTTGRAKGFKKVDITWTQNETVNTEFQASINFQPQFDDLLDRFILNENDTDKQYQSISANDLENDKIEIEI